MEEKVKGKKMPIDLNPNMPGVNQTPESQPTPGAPSGKPDDAAANAFQQLLKDSKQEGGSSSQKSGDQAHAWVANPFAKSAQGGATAKEAGSSATAAPLAGSPSASATTSSISQSSEADRTSAMSEKSSALTGEQLSQLAQGQGIPQAANTGAATAPTEASNTPAIDGEKVQALVDAVVKELAVRDLSSIRLTGELSIPLDPSILPDTALKVRFEGDTMVVSIDSKSKDVNGFCRDNLDSLKNALVSSAPEGAQVRVEIRADQQTAQAGQSNQSTSQGNTSGQDNQSGQSEGRQQAEDERQRQHQAFEPKA
jgi:hypothetical protein